REVGVPVAARIRAVGPDSADLGGEVEDELRPRLREQPLDLGGDGEVVLASPRDERVDPVRAQPLDEMRAEEAPAARDEDVHRAGSVFADGVSQSTRPIQLSRRSAYQAIVFETPSSQGTSGSQPVSR